MTREKCLSKTPLLVFRFEKDQHQTQVYLYTYYIRYKDSFLTSLPKALKTKTLDHGANTTMSVCELSGCDDHVQLGQAIGVEHLLKETDPSLVGYSESFLYMEVAHLWSRFL